MKLHNSYIIYDEISVVFGLTATIVEFGCMPLHCWIAEEPCKVQPGPGRVWSLIIAVPSGAIVTCLKFASTPAGLEGRLLCLRISPVSPSSNTTCLANAKMILPSGKMLRLFDAIQPLFVLALSKYVRQICAPVVASALAT